MGMGKASRGKRDRVSAPVTRSPMASYLPSRATLLFVAGVIVLTYGLGTLKYSRWDHAYNRTLGPPTPHIWAIVVGVGLLVYTYKRP